MDIEKGQKKSPVDILVFRVGEGRQRGHLIVAVTLLYTSVPLFVDGTVGSRVMAGSGQGEI